MKTIGKSRKPLENHEQHLENKQNIRKSRKPLKIKKTVRKSQTTLGKSQKQHWQSKQHIGQR